MVNVVDETETNNIATITTIDDAVNPLAKRSSSTGAGGAGSVNNNNSARSSRVSSSDQTQATCTLPAETLASQQLQQHQFGWGQFRPRCLRRFCNAKWALFWLCWGGALQGLIVNGFINVVISTIERRFGLRSSQTGLVACGYDIASFLCLVPVTYFGGRHGASKPFFIAIGLIMMGIGSLTFALPHFLVGNYRATIAEANICVAHEDAMNFTLTEACANADNVDGENLTWTVWFFFAAQLLHGAGASPLFTLGVTYIDENVSKKMSSVYLGIYYTMAIIGPAIGYVLGGQLLLIYTDFIDVDPAQLSLTSESKVWIGAWWIGFVFAAVACVLLAIPIFAYPKSLPGAEKLQLAKVSEAYGAASNKQQQQTQPAEPPTDEKHKYSKVHELPRALCALMKNPTFFFLNLAGATEGLVIAGFAAFLPKQIENQFSISPVWSALLMGLITVPAGGGGTFLGGYLVKRFNLACGGIIKMCLICTLIATCFTSCFLLSCPNMHFAGVTSGDATLQLTAECNAKCACSALNYDPICGVDGVMYYSPCHAGCTQEQSVGALKIYENCSCIADGRLDAAVTDVFDVEGADATNNRCESTCRNLPYFVTLCSLLMLFTFLATMPALSATLRCVHDEQRSFALGIQWIKVRLLGTIPAPLIFGTLIDETCLLWQATCDEQSSGACLVYDNFYISRYMWLLALVGKLLSVTFFLGAWWFYIPPSANCKTTATSQQQQQPHP